MKTASAEVKRFFDDYERSTGQLDPELLTTLYADAFMFGGPQGAQAVKLDDFLKVVPKRQGFFQAVGLTSTKILSLEETDLDDSYIQVKVYWQMRFEKAGQPPTLDENSATYILRRQGSALRIVFQLDHQDLMKRVEELGLLPAQ
jgi:hypothetical protein